MTRRSQTCTAAGSSLVVIARREPSGLNVAKSHVAQIRTLEPGYRTAGFGLDQEQDLARFLNHEVTTVGRETESGSADLSLFLPGAGGPEPAGWAGSHEPSPVGTEDDCGAIVD